MRLDVQNGHVCGVVTALGGYYRCSAVVIATGTALGGRIFVGEAHYDSGPDGTHAATALTKDLTAHGVPLRRFKTGTPARVHRRSIDFSKLDCQPGDPDAELLAVQLYDPHADAQQGGLLHRLHEPGDP